MKTLPAAALLAFFAASGPSAEAEAQPRPQASRQPAAAAKRVTQPPEAAIEKSIRADLSSRSGNRFDALLDKWQKEHGTRAVAPLLKLASDNKLADADRYIAVLASARLGGAATAKAVSAYLSDKSWMVRTAALRALTALKDPETSGAVLELLKDPALVVRNEAVVAAEALRPKGTVDALVAAIQDEKNYHRGKAQWVPQNALDALVRLGAPGSVASRLVSILERKTDPALLLKAVQTFDRLTGTKTASGVSLDEQVRRWKTTLASRET